MCNLTINILNSSKYNKQSVICCALCVRCVILGDYKTQRPRPDRGRRGKKGAGKRRGAVPIRAHSRMLIMQLQLYQLTCKLPIWTQRERERQTDIWRDRKREKYRQSESDMADTGLNI